MDRAIHRLTSWRETLVDDQAFLEQGLGSSADEAADRLSAIDVGELVIRPVTLGFVRVGARQSARPHTWY